MKILTMNFESKLKSKETPTIVLPPPICKDVEGEVSSTQ